MATKSKHSKKKTKIRAKKDATIQFKTFARTETKKKHMNENATRMKRPDAFTRS